MKRILKKIYDNRIEYIYYTLLMQLITSIISFLLINIGFRLILFFTKQKNIDMSNIKKIILNPLGLITIVIFFMIIAFLLMLEFASTILLIYNTDENVKFINIVKLAISRLNKVFGFQIIFFIIYFIFLIPFSDFVIKINLLKSVYIPDFIIGELLKTRLWTVILFIIFLLVVYINLRLIFVIPLMILEDNSKLLDNIKQSMKITKNNKKIIVDILLSQFLIGLIAVMIYFPILYISTKLPDTIIFGAIFLTISQILIFVFAMISKITIICIMVEKIKITKANFNKVVEKKHSLIIFAISSIILMIFNILVLENTKLNENIVLIGHRGYTKNSIENTIKGIKDAKKNGAKLAEIDIQSTKDGKLIVMHDTNLKRLAGIDKKVADLNFNQVHNMKISQNGLEDKIPSFEEAIITAKNNNIKLLVEIKVNGLEDEKYFDLVYNTMKKYDVLDYPIMSIDENIIKNLEMRYPVLNTGYVIPIQFGGFNNDINDFYVVEDFSYSKKLLNQAKQKNKKIFVWTINDETKIEKYLYEDIDGIITDELNLVNEKYKEFKENNSYFDKSYRFLKWK